MGMPHGDVQVGAGSRAQGPIPMSAPGLSIPQQRELRITAMRQFKPAVQNQSIHVELAAEAGSREIMPLQTFRAGVS